MLFIFGVAAACIVFLFLLRHLDARRTERGWKALEDACLEDLTFINEHFMQPAIHRFAFWCNDVGIKGEYSKNGEMNGTVYMPEEEAGEARLDDAEKVYMSYYGEIDRQFMYKIIQETMGDTVMYRVAIHPFCKQPTVFTMPRQDRKVSHELDEIFKQVRRFLDSLQEQWGGESNAFEIDLNKVAGLHLN